MKVTETYIKGCFVLEPNVFEDERGIFFESYNKKLFEKEIGRKVDFVQDNHSVSKKGVLRGLHFQQGEHSQAKLLRVVKGEILDVVVDLRKESSTFGQHFKINLSSKDKKMLFMPKGMAHGFLVLEENTAFAYKCDNYYNKDADSGIFYADADLKIDWEFSTQEIILSKKDKNLQTFKDFCG